MIYHQAGWAFTQWKLPALTFNKRNVPATIIGMLTWHSITLPTMCTRLRYCTAHNMALPAKLCAISVQFLNDAKTEQHFMQMHGNIAWEVDAWAVRYFFILSILYILVCTSTCIFPNEWEMILYHSLAKLQVRHRRCKYSLELSRAKKEKTLLLCAIMWLWVILEP